MSLFRLNIFFFSTALLALLSFGCYFYLCGEIHWSTVNSPCGKYKVEFYAYRYGYLACYAPGSGSDKPGCAYVKEAGGKKLLRAELPMMWMRHDLDWYRESEEYGVEIRCVFDIVLEPQRRIIYDSWN